MSALDDFINDPPAFMRRNLVTYVGIRPSLQGGAEHDFFLIDVGKAARTRSGVFLGMSINKADAGVYEIRYAGALALDDERRGHGEEFRAVWGGFVPRGKVEVALGRAGAAIMLTPELTGCTVAFASPANGAARFSHYNLMDGGGRTLDRAGMRSEAEADYSGVAHGLLTKEDYYAKSSADMREPGQIGAVGQIVNKLLPRAHAGPRASVIGWRRGDQWTFWVQYTDMKGAVHQILDVEQLQPGTQQIG